MQKSYRIRTKIGEDSHIKVNLQQDFDLLEILSLKLTQSEVYSSLCADYGVVVGRVVANSGLGIPNATISVFIPLASEDKEDETITALYPYTDVTDKNEEGYRYNLLPKEKQHNRHTPTGSFFTAEEIVSNPIKLEVYEKYYKFSAKTNSAGDFMIWGVPLGVHQLHMSVDVSNIGCFSMKPFDFISQGEHYQKFKSSAEFKSSENLDTLPQIVIQNKTIEVVPFWGDDELCNAGISRTDFDLRDSNVEIRPNALLMGSILSDNNIENVNWKCGPSKRMGEVCKLTTGSGKIEAVRFTVFKEEDGCRPKLEKVNLYKIGGNGSFVCEVPMNLDYIYTDEYGNQQISDDPSIGVPTRGKYRFRISFDQEYSSESRKGKYLVPNLREYTLGGNYFAASYSFSTNLEDYPDANPAFGDDWQTSPAFLGFDYFYEMKPDRVYTVSQHIDLYRNNYQFNDFNSDATTSGSWPFLRTGEGAISNRWNFIGIKSTNPAYEADCSGSIKEFPPIDGFRGGSFIFLMTQLNLFITQIAIFVPFLLLALSIIIGSFNLFMQMVAMFADLAAHTSEFINFVAGLGINVPLGDILGAVGTVVGIGLIAAVEITLSLIMVSAINSMRYNLPLTKYDECENCNCGNFFTLKISGIFGLGKFEEDAGDVLVDDPLCQIPALCADPSDPGGSNCSGSFLYYSTLHGEELDNEGRGRQSNKGCYTISYDGSGFKQAFTAAMITLAIAGVALGLIPGLGAAVGPLVQDLVVGAFVATIAVFLLTRLANIFIGLNEWRVRKNIYNGLCQGVFNLGFWNAWIRGTLYHFRFENKLDKRTDPVDLTETTTDFCCRDVIVSPDMLTADNPHYYYRSCPWTNGAYNPDNVSAVYTFDWFHEDSGGNEVSNSLDYRKNKGIMYPTTLTELGTFEDLSINNYCVDCDEEADTDFFINKMESSSQKSPAGVLDYIITQKMMKYSFWQIHKTGINNWFGGRVDLLNFTSPPLILGHDRNQRNIRQAQYRLLDGDISQIIGLNNEFGIHKYLSPMSFPTDPQYGPLPLGAIDPDIGNVFSNKEMKIADTDLRQSLLGGQNGYTFAQQIPYYPWAKANQIFGNRDNNWDVSGGNVITNRNQPGILIQPKTGPIFYGIPQGTETSFGFYHYYFGLYQGNTSYDEFVNKYMPPVDVIDE